MFFGEGGEFLYFVSFVIVNLVFCNCFVFDLFFNLLFLKDFILEENWYSVCDIYYVIDVRNGCSFLKFIGEIVMKFSKFVIVVVIVIVLSFLMVNVFVVQFISLVVNDIMQKIEEVVFDIWIISKVKFSLIVNKNVSGVDIKVEINKGVVFFFGNVKSDVECDLVIEIVKGIKGVKVVFVDGLKLVE